MSAGFNLAETTIFIPEAVLEPVTKELGENGLTVLPHPVPVVHHGKGGETAGQMVDILGLYLPLTQTLARTFIAYGLKDLNNPTFIFPFVQSE